MRSRLKIAAGITAWIFLAMAFSSGSASAITAEVARKCSTLSSKAFPPRVVGNPAAGIQNGSYQDFRNYFNKCVANGGNPPEQENQQPSQSPDAGKDKDKQPSKQSQ